MVWKPTFVLLLCLAFPVVFYLSRTSRSHLSPSNWARTALCALHPFSAAFARLEALLLCLKKWCYKDEMDSHSYTKATDVLVYIDFAVLFEAVLECAPQFIIQLYAISVQEEPAAIIQIISLPISFLTLAWAFTATDKMSLVVNKIIPSSSDLNVKHQLALFVTHLLLLSSRLFAICYFTVSYKWWVIGVLMVHCCVVVIATVIQNRNEGFCNSNVLFILLFIGIHSLRDDFVELSLDVQKNWSNHVFLTYFVCIRKLLYDPNVSFHLSLQRLVLFTCHCVCLCVQCSRLHNENLLITWA